jgi:hypothetical protein
MVRKNIKRATAIRKGWDEKRRRTEETLRG